MRQKITNFFAPKNWQKIIFIFLKKILTKRICHSIMRIVFYKQGDIILKKVH